MSVQVLVKEQETKEVEVNEVILKRMFHFVIKYKSQKDGTYEVNLDTVSSYLAYIGVINLDDLGKTFINNDICRAYLDALIEGKYFNKTTTKVYWNSSRKGNYKLCRKLGSNGRKMMSK